MLNKRKTPGATSMYEKWSGLSWGTQGSLPWDSDI